MGNADDAAYMETFLSPTPLDKEKAAERLREVKQVFDELGVTFWLRSGTLFGIIRAGAFIDWDDEMDTASVLGMHGVSDETVRRVADAFRARGFIVQALSGPRYVAAAFVKDGVRTDWTCYRLVGGRAYEFPGIEIPLHVFDDLREIEFVGERFLIPNPPEDYLQAKYGPDWRTPKGPGFEADVVRQVADGSMVSRRARLLWKASGGRLAARVGVRVYDRDGALVRGARVRVVGVGETAANAQGLARFPVPAEDYYAVTVAYPGHNEVLYMETLKPGTNYVYRPGPVVTAEEHYKAGVRALALIEE